MKLLLDTHVLLWSATAPDELTAAARAAIEDGANEVLVSTIVGWEIAIKQSIGKLDLPLPAERWLPPVISRSGFGVIAPGMTAALRVRALPWHHRDPFDRFLVAHALEEGLVLVTRDTLLASYGVPILAA